MIKIKTTDLTRKKVTKREDFLDKQFRVVSRSGLHNLEKGLINYLGGLSLMDGPVLFIENRTGVAPIVFKNLFPNNELFINNFDIHHSKTVKRTFDQNEIIGEYKIVTEPNLPLHKYELIFFQIAKDLPTELAQEVIQQSAIQLKKNGKIVILGENRNLNIKEFLQDCFQGSTAYESNKKYFIEVAKKKNEMKKLKKFESTFEVPNKMELTIELVTMPGVFAHRRMDTGALAMFESIEPEPNSKILDLGCGCGSIAISLSKKTTNSELHFVDANARAIENSKINCQKNNILNGSFYLTDIGIEKPNYFDLVVGNPPYFSDYKIAETFINNAYLNLKKNGHAYIVAKSIEWYENNMKELFGNIEIKKRRGYCIAHSIKKTNSKK